MAPGVGIVCALAATAVALSPRAARAEDPPNLDDRVFLYARAGMALTTGSVTHTTDGHVFAADDVTGPIGPTGGFGVSFWPTDYTAFDAQFDATSLHLGTVRRFDRCDGGASCVASHPPAYDAALLGSSYGVRFAVPFRYFQPYVGAGIGAHVTTLLADNPKDGTSQKVSDSGLLTPLVAGVSFYFSRHLRFFVDYRMFVTPSNVFGTSDKVSLMFHDLRAQSLGMGLAVGEERNVRRQKDTAFGIIFASLPVGCFLLSLLTK